MTQDQRAKILLAVSKGELDPDTALAMIGQGGGGNRPFKMSVSEKGCLHLSGVPGAPVKFGVTQYVEVFEFVLDRAKEIREFIAKHPELARKQRAA